MSTALAASTASAADCYVLISDLNFDGVLDSIVSEDTSSWGQGGGAYEIRLSQENTPERLKFVVWGSSGGATFMLEHEENCPTRLWWGQRAGNRGAFSYINMDDPTDTGSLQGGKNTATASTIDLLIWKAITENTKALPTKLIKDYPDPFLPE